MGYEEFFSKLQALIAVVAPLIPVIAGLVEFAKILGLPSEKYAVAGAVIVGVVLTVSIQASILYPVIEPWLLAVLVGILAGMTATGLYQIGSRWAAKVGKGS